MVNTQGKYDEIIAFIEDNITNFNDYEKDIDLLEATLRKFRAVASSCREMNTIMQFMTEQLLRQYIKERKLMAAYECIIQAQPRNKNLPKETKERCLQITGYDSDSAFDKAFRARFGMAPTVAMQNRDHSLITDPLTWDAVSNPEGRRQV